MTSEAQSTFKRLSGMDQADAHLAIERFWRQLTRKDQKAIKAVWDTERPPE
jgi:hypothetical protein